MSAFALPMPPAPLAGNLHRPTERSATTCRRQKSEIRNQNRRDADPRASGQSPDIRPATAPPLRYRYSQDPGSRASTPASRRPIRSPSSRNGQTRAAIMFGDQSLRRDWHISISRRGGFDRRAQTARSAESRGSPGAPPATAATPAGILQDPRPARSTRSLLCVLFSAVLISDFCLLHIRSFGAWLEPRYIFGAGRLIDQ
jgi:hypothetical protein